MAVVAVEGLELVLAEEAREEEEADGDARGDDLIRGKGRGRGRGRSRGRGGMLELRTCSLPQGNTLSCSLR